MITHSVGLSVEQEFRKITPYLYYGCPGEQLVYECVVVGGGGTYWNGTALQNCSQDRILVRHSQVESGHNTTETCGSTGQVVSRPVSAVNNSYTTQFIITASIELNGSTIGCTADDGTFVGGSEVSLTTGNG